MDKKKLIAIRDFIVNAEKSVKNAKKILKDLIDENGMNMEDLVELDSSGLNSYKSGSSKIVEGVFTGEDMMDAEGSKYPVPANYASKSKMVQGDKLKLTIDESGKMMYKQIQPITRETKVGLLSKDQGKFQVVCEGKTYNVLTAAVTHFKGEIGDSISVLVPAGKDATYAAIEAVIPKE